MQIKFISTKKGVNCQFRFHEQGRRSSISTGGGEGLRLKTRAGGGSRGIPPEKILKSRGSELVFSIFSMRYFSKKPLSWIRCKMTGTNLVLRACNVFVLPSGYSYGTRS